MANYIDDSKKRFRNIQNNMSQKKTLKNKVRSYTAHMHIKYDINPNKFSEYYRYNMNRARNDREFKKWVLKEY